jgi:hypothetical protein
MNEQSALISNVIGPAVVVVAAVLALAVVGVLIYALIKPSEARRRIEGLFRRPRRERPVGDGHYYKPYWHTK